MDKKIIANPTLVLREEFDDWALLFDPDTGEVYGLNPVSVFIWKNLDGKNSVDEIVQKLKSSCEELPESAKDDVNTYIDELVKNGLAGYEA